MRPSTLMRLHLSRSLKPLTLPRLAVLSNMLSGRSFALAMRENGGLTAPAACRPSKFPNISRLTLFFPSNHGEDTSRISFVGFKGEYSPMTVSRSRSKIHYASFTKLIRSSYRSATLSSPSTKLKPIPRITPRFLGSATRLTLVWVEEQKAITGLQSGLLYMLYCFCSALCFYGCQA